MKLSASSVTQVKHHNQPSLVHINYPNYNMIVSFLPLSFLVTMSIRESSLLYSFCIAVLVTQDSAVCTLMRHITLVEYGWCTTIFFYVLIDNRGLKCRPHLNKSFLIFSGYVWLLSRAGQKYIASIHSSTTVPTLPLSSSFAFIPSDLSLGTYILLSQLSNELIYTTLLQS